MVLLSTRFADEVSRSSSGEARTFMLFDAMGSQVHYHSHLEIEIVLSRCVSGIEESFIFAAGVAIVHADEEVSV